MQSPEEHARMARFERLEAKAWSQEVHGDWRRGVARDIRPSGVAPWRGLSARTKLATEVTVLLLLFGCVAPEPTTKDSDGGDSAVDSVETGETGETAETDTQETSETDVSHGPDLLANRIQTDPPDAHLNDLVTYTVTAENIGDEDAPAVQGGIYYSNNSRVNTSDPFVCAFTFDPLAAGDQASTEVACVVPTLPQGTYAAGVFLDDDEQLDELDETNNTDVGGDITQVEVGDWPDLTFGYLYADEYDVQGGASIKVHYSVENHGTLDTSTYIPLDLHLSEDAEITADDAQVAATFINYIVPVDGEVLYYGYIDLPEVAADTTLYLGGIIDADNGLDEQDESNNTYVDASTFLVHPLPTYDVRVVSVATPDTVAVEADSVSYTIELANDGNTDTSSFSVALTYSDDTTIDTSDARLCTVPVTTPVPAGGASTLTGSCVVPAGLDGSYWFGVVADSTGVIAETDETNNTGYDATSQVALSPAHWDLEPVVASAVDYAVDWGDRVTFTYDVRNNGTTARTGFDVNLYYSTNTAIAVTDTLLCTDSVTSTLAAGSTGTYSVTCDIPALMAGSYYFGVLVDPDDDVAEDDETNNSAYDAAPVDHDGVDWNLEAELVYQNDYIVTSGDSETFHFQVVNDGVDAIDDYTIELYYSRDATITTSDTLICSFPAESIAGLSRETYTASCNIPSVSTVAAYYLGLLVDPDRDIAETDETNNEMFDTSAVTIYP